MSPERKLRPGEVYTTPVTFVTVYVGDYYEPLRAYAQLLERRGWALAQPNQEDFGANWCSWGYRSNITPALLLGTIPKLKELGFKWATLDYRWFVNFGEWEPRPDTFPGDSIRKVVDEFHRQGFRVQLWWLPLAVGDGQKWEPIDEFERQPASIRQQMQPAQVVREHPEWLILDKNEQADQRLSESRHALPGVAGSAGLPPPADGKVHSRLGL